MTQPRASILVVDDSEIVLRAAKVVLEAHGFHVRIAANLAELERTLADGKPDLIVLDVNMPEMYGDDVARVLRDVRQLDVPVILFSDLDEGALAARGRAGGLHSVVAKRDGLPALVAQVESLLAP